MNRDYNDMLSALCAEGAEFLIVGAYALGAHGIPRATGDIEIWVRPSAENAQMGVPPSRIDLLTGISGVTFDQAWAARVSVAIDGLTVPVIGRDHLVRNKAACGCLKDLADLVMLRAGSKKPSRRKPGGGPRR